MESYFEFLPNDLYKIVFSYLFDIHGVVSMNELYPEKEELIYNVITLLRSNTITHVPFDKFKLYRNLIHSDNNILFDINDISQLEYFNKFRSVDNINFYINTKLIHEFDTIPYFEELIKYLPFDLFTNKIVRLIFEVTEPTEDYAYVIDGNKIMIANINQNRYLSVETKVSERTYWNEDITDIIKLRYPDLTIYSIVYSSTEVISYKDQTEFNINLFDEGGKLSLKNKNNLFIYIKTDGTNELYYLHNILKEFMMTANFKYINNKIFERLIYVDKEFIEALIGLYLLANNLYKNNEVLVDDFINKYFMLELPPLDLTKGQYYTTYNNIIDNIFTFLKPVDKITLEKIINLRLPPERSYVKDHLIQKDYNYMTLVKRKLSMK